MVEFFFFFYCLCDEEGEGGWWVEVAGAAVVVGVMGRANYKKKYYTCHIFIFWVVVELATGRASDRLPKR